MSELLYAAFDESVEDTYDDFIYSLLLQEQVEENKKKRIKKKRRKK